MIWHSSQQRGLLEFQSSPAYCPHCQTSRHLFVRSCSFPCAGLTLNMNSTPTTTKIGHGLVKILGIKLQYRNPTGEDHLTRGESVFSVSTADTFVEEEPSSLEWIRQVAPTRRTFLNWAYNLFPFTHWIGRYNGTWLIGDLVAGQ